jgi:eukaryotic-like serine/threonine-protein kinase
MSPDRWNELRSLYDLALDHSPQDRQQVLSSRSGVDKELVDEVLRMIELEEAAGDFLDKSPARALRQQLGEPQPLLEPGESIAQRFNIIRLLGSGGMGEVYEAEDTDLGERVALKTIRLDRLSDLKAHQRLRREALLARKITHPNVCRTFDILRHQRHNEEFAILSMELLTGQTLAEHLKQSGPLPADRAESILRQVLAALNAAHQAGVIHRDLKPSNIMLSGPRAVVMDFGLAVQGTALTRESLTTLTHSGQLLGTPEYMAPEQIRNQPVTERSDIYSLGVVLFEMLTGQRPTQGATGIEEVLNRILEPPPSPRAINPSISRRWEAITLRCLEREPDRRYPSAAALLADLDSHWHLPRIHISRRAMIISGSAVAAIGIGSRYLNQPAFLASKIIVAPVENTTAEPTFDTLSSLLEHQLTQSGNIQVTPAARLNQLRQQIGLQPQSTPSKANYREMALREGAPGVVFTSLVSRNGEYEIHVRLEEVTQSPLRPSRSWTRDFSASSKQELFTRLDEAARWLRQQSGESLTEISRFDRPAEDTTTNSWEAWRLYSSSRTLATKGDIIGASSLLQNAVRLDPNFAMAWRDLADYQVRRNDYHNGYQSWSRALQALDARQFTTVEGLLIRATYYEDSAQYDKAEPLYRSLLTLQPKDHRIKLYLGSVLAFRRKFAEARAIFEGALTAHPDKQQLWSHLTPLYLLSNEPALAEKAVSSLRRASLPGLADYSEFQLAFATADTKQADAASLRLANSKEAIWLVRGPVLRAAFFAHHQDWPQVTAILESALAQAHREAASSWQDRLPTWLLYLKTKNPANSLESLRSEWASIGKQQQTPSWQFFLDHATVGYLLGCPFDQSVPAAWPDLPHFQFAKLQLELLKAPSRPALSQLLITASRNSPHNCRRALGLAKLVASRERWPKEDLDNILSVRMPGLWQADELNLPSGLRV